MFYTPYSRFIPLHTLFNPPQQQALFAIVPAFDQARAHPLQAIAPRHHLNRKILALHIEER